MTYLKPQSPLYHKAEDAYFYPLTTIDQVVAEDGRRLNAVLKDSVVPTPTTDDNGKILKVVNGTPAWTATDNAVGVELNFSVVGGTDEPSNPTENMIWVNTEYDITKVVFRSVEPSNPVEGMVCIYTGTGSNASFDRIVVNGIGIDEVYPISAKQYVSGEWEEKTAKSYQGGQWVEWITYLYNAGNEYIDITGGWVGSDQGFSKESNAINLSGLYGQYMGIAYTDNIIDVTNYNTLTIYVSDIVGTDGENIFGLSSVKLDQNLNIASKSVKANGYVDLDISQIQGSYYVGIRSYWNTSGKASSMRVTQAKFS